MRAALFLLLSIGMSSPLPAHAAPISGSPELTDDQLMLKLIDGLNDPDSEVRMNLGMAIAQMGSKTVLPLIEALDHGSAFQRAGAAYALSQLRAAARPAVPSLVKALKAPEEMIRRTASYALSRILSAPETTARTPESAKPVVLPPLDPTPGALPLGAPR